MSYPRIAWAYWPALDVCLVALIEHAPVVAQQPDEPQALFDGRTLNGWKGDETLWRIEDNAITGETKPEAPIRANSFLIWDGGELENFELRLKFRIFSGNSGVQYRSRDLGDFQVGGYQADIDADGNWIGILYDEHGRGILCRRGERVSIGKDGQRTTATIDDFDQEKFSTATPGGQWHEYVIRAEGSKVSQAINGITTIELDDHEQGKAHARGIIALQLHSGPAMKVQFKDITLKRLP
ncbi:MAG TPA: DUF1080 domain-containing protein [Pirellulaceae bacterium]|nr:DUF1080 domain-containing protein [Pirellulaceae bacterium]